MKYTANIGLWYPKGAHFDLVGFSDSDYAGCKVDSKSNSVGCPFFGRSLVSWSSKKQNSVALSTAEAEYISARSCCAQLLWMKQTLLDYGVKFDEILLLCDNESVTPGLQKNINRAIIYVPGSSHTYIQQNEQYIIAHIT